jgi:hypothetical protein
MKELSITEYSMPFDKDRKMNTKDFINIVLNQPPQGGFTPKTLKDSRRIDDAIDNSKDGVIYLEDQDVTFLKQRCEESRWNIRSKDIESFLDSVRELDAKKK